MRPLITQLKKHKARERRACRALSVNRSSFRYEVKILSDEDEVRNRIIELVCNYGRVRYRKVTGILRNEGILSTIKE